MTPLTGAAPDHLLIAPLLIPLIAGALMLFYDDRRRWLKFGIGLAAILLLANVSLSLMDRVGQADGARVYILGNWPVPMGIVLVRRRTTRAMRRTPARRRAHRRSLPMRPQGLAPRRAARPRPALVPPVAP